MRAFGDDQQVSFDQLVYSTQGFKPFPHSCLSFDFFKHISMMEVGMSKNPGEPTGLLGQVAGRRGWKRRQSGREEVGGGQEVCVLVKSASMSSSSVSGMSNSWCDANNSRMQSVINRTTSIPISSYMSNTQVLPLSRLHLWTRLPCAHAQESIYKRYEVEWDSTEVFVDPLETVFRL